MLGLPRLGAELLFTYMHILIHEHPLPQTGVAWLGKCSGSNVIDRFLQPLHISTQTTLLEPTVHAAYHHLAFVSWGNHPQRWDGVQHSASNGRVCRDFTSDNRWTFKNVVRRTASSFSALLLLHTFNLQKLDVSMQLTAAEGCMLG